MKRIHPDALQPQLRWLILTGNSITELPATIGRCKKLQKLMLSGNAIESLPESIDQLSNLELVRLACNQLHEVCTKDESRCV
jgi:Leucine-rich repeat (LRR) protein